MVIIKLCKKIDSQGYAIEMVMFNHML